MGRKLRGRRVSKAEVRQPKCLNVPVARFRKLVEGKEIGPVTSRGKWIFVRLEPAAWLLLNLGMGGDLLYHEREVPEGEGYQVRLSFEDGASLTVRFWWFGYVHAADDAALAKHGMTATLGLDPLSKREFSYERFADLLGERRGNVKAFLLDQKQIAGIGNVYIQDILFRAGLHPNRKVADIPPEERRRLHAAIVENLREATALGGLRYEKDLFGRSGRFDHFLVGYREGKPCPTCGTTIEKIRTGSTASFVCGKCQR
jgi:formamidopyrimidine-DNA glycosylase